ncbi:MAG TPA: hypothetical protein VFE61_07815 [Candidatus Sulfotelmatobacter sp.]|jgi:hypothetical protein|nr:hypothetical protein [Candidatus Sulfotelmatobacter sp.]
MRSNAKMLSLLTIGVLAVSCGVALAQSGTCSGMSLGQGANLNGFVPFQASSLWNTDISAAPVDANSANIINFIGSTVTLHPDFGAGTFHNQTLGIPYQVVAGTQAKVPVTLGAFFDESDPGPEPIPANALIEGYPKPGNGDRHVLVLDKDGCWLYELFHATLKSGNWSADSTAIWDMTINEQRPYTWTSADAAGLPVFVGLARYDEVAAGAINHALRFTVPTSQKAFVLPATHWASTTTSTSAPPMGTRLRLKASFDISTYPADDQVILTALKKYGMILADNGSAIFISGVPDNRWNNTNLNLLKAITASNFDVVQQGTIYTPANVPTGASPTISSFTANPSTVTAGSPVTLSWSITNSTYNIVDPQAGPVRGTSVVVVPSATTTYTLNSTNQFGRTTATATVTVH